MVKRVISSVVVLSLVLSFFGVTYAANNFKDVDAEKLSWAVEAIDKMVDKAIVSGYPDGTFKPDKSVSKIEALLLISRILGVNDSAYVDTMDGIVAKYQDALSNVNTTYTKELSFLLHKGVFTVDEISNMDFSSPLKRYEAAIYLTKALNSEDKLDASIIKTSYKDDSAIPAEAKKNVEYCSKNGIMMGTSEEDFSPNTDVTRAQIAVLLYRVMQKANVTIIKGVVDDITMTNIKVVVGKDVGIYEFSEGTSFLLNQKTASAVDIQMDYDVILTFMKGELVQLEAFGQPVVYEKVVDGEIKSIVNAEEKTILIKGIDTGVLSDYTLAKRCEIKINGTVATLQNLRNGDYVKLYISDKQEILKVEAQTINAEISDAVVLDITTDPTVTIKVQLKDGTVKDYNVLSDVVVRRNLKASDLPSIVKGDKIASATIKYDRFSKIDLITETKDLSGVIEEVRISKNPSITVKIAGESTVLDMSKGAKIYMVGQEKTFYDLRVGLSVKITTESGVVTKLDVQASSDVMTKTGKVEFVNTSYGFITLAVDGGESEQIFINKATAKITDNQTGASKSLQDIKAGYSIIAIGSITNGAFEAKTVVITSK